METNPKIFRAYDIRGIYQKDFDEELAYKLGLAYCHMRRKELGKEDLQITAGCDMRTSSPILKEYLIKGLSEGGAKVIDIGICSTPTFYFAVSNYGYDGGIMVSASHNPKEYNGFKITRNKAISIGMGSGMEDLKELVFKDLSRSDYGEIIEKKDILIEQVKHDLKYADISRIKPLRIVIDPANAMGAQYFDELFKHLPCELIRMNWDLDGSFPAHEADPFKAENVKDLGERVVKEGADLGIATDGDGDRIFFVDELGEPIEAGITRAILCKLFLKEKPGAKIAYDVRPGRITKDVIVENGGEPIVTMVGHTLIKLKVLEVGAYFAGESSGHFFLNMPDGCYEIPMIVALKILQELSESGMRFSHYIKDYQKYYHSGEINLNIDNAEEKIQMIKEKYSDAKLSDMDGISAEYDDFWFNVRLSNTQPLLRLNLEAKTKEIMLQKRDELLELIKG
ncbi:MAG: phosphomannomutase/phosphoglucomutase [bacterium]